MRLGKVEKGQKLKYRMILRAVGAVTRGRAPDVMQVMFYRRELYGEHFGKLLTRAVCGPSFWTRCERELFAAWTSAVLECDF